MFLKKFAPLFALAILFLGVFCSMNVCAQENETDECGDSEFEEQEQEWIDLLGTGALIDAISVLFFFFGLVLIIVGIMIFLTPMPFGRIVGLAIALGGAGLFVIGVSVMWILAILGVI